METVAVTLVNPVAVGFWFTIGCSLAGLVAGIVGAVLLGIFRLIVG